MHIHEGLKVSFFTDLISALVGGVSLNSATRKAIQGTKSYLNS